MWNISWWQITKLLWRPSSDRITKQNIGTFNSFNLFKAIASCIEISVLKCLIKTHIFSFMSLEWLHSRIKKNKRLLGFSYRFGIKLPWHLRKIKYPDVLLSSSLSPLAFPSGGMGSQKYAGDGGGGGGELSQPKWKEQTLYRLTSRT